LSRAARAALAAGLLVVAAAASASVAEAESPRVLFMLHCQGCHRPDGSGLPGAVPDLRGSLARFLSVPGGRAYLVRVPGSATSRLDAAELASVLNWMVVRFGPAAAAGDAAPYSAEEVARMRVRPLVDVAATRRALLAELGGNHEARSVRPAAGAAPATP